VHHAPPDGSGSQTRRRDRRRLDPCQRGPGGRRRRDRGLRAGPGESVMRKRIAILFGGRSAEHEVSVISAGAVQRALDPERYEPLFIGITREGTWHLLDGPPALAAGANELPAVTTEPG